MQYSRLVWVRPCGVVLLALTVPGIGFGALAIQGYDPVRHDRFSTDAKTAFVGEGLDFSGVGRTSDNRWVTMISPTYFVSAAHRFPRPGTKAKFYQGNVKSSEFLHEYVIDDFSVPMQWNGFPSDLKVGRLVVPPDGTEAIAPEDGIAWYPIRAENAFDYHDAELFVYGLADRVGKNNIFRTCSLDNRNFDNRCVTYVMEFRYDTNDTGQGPDEAYLMTGDSGGPSFVVSNGELALAGIHYYNYGSNPVDGSISGDSFVPAYLDQITGFWIEGDVNADQLVSGEDLDLLRECWGVVPESRANLNPDLTGDGLVNTDDLDVVRRRWNQTGPAVWHHVTKEDAAAVPEPCAAWLLLSATFYLTGFRRREPER